MGILFFSSRKKMIAEATGTRRSNWKLYVVAITCVCFVAGMLVNSVSESAPADNELDSVVTQALKMFHGSKANMPNDDDYLAGEADFQKRFKTLKGKADLSAERDTHRLEGHECQECPGCWCHREGLPPEGYQGCHCQGSGRFGIGIRQCLVNWDRAIHLPRCLGTKYPRS